MSAFLLGGRIKHDKKEFAKLLFEKGVFTTRTEAEKKVDIIFDSIEKFY